MSEFSVGIAQERLVEINTRLSSRMQEISQQTGVPFAQLFTQEISRARSADVAETDEPDDADTVAIVPDTAPYAATEDVSVEAEQPVFAESGDGYAAIIENIADEYGVSPALVRAVIQAESDYDAELVSAAGAMGLMQLMPTTAEGLGVTDAFDPRQNVDGGVRYLLGQIIRFGGDIKTALAAYNYGPGGLTSRGIKDVNDPVQWAQLPEETKRYIDRIAALLASFGEGELLEKNFFA